MLINKIVHFSLHLFSFRNLGRVNHLLVFNFEGFEIGRYITSNVEDPRQAVLSPSAPYQRSHNRTKDAWKKVADSNSGEQWIVPGEKPLRYMYMYAILKTRISVVVCISFSGSRGGGGGGIMVSLLDMSGDCIWIQTAHVWRWMLILVIVLCSQASWHFILIILTVPLPTQVHKIKS